MKKIITILTMAFAALVCNAQSESELLELQKMYESAMSLKASATSADYFASLKIYRAELTQPKIFASRLHCRPHTFAWYLWCEYDRSNSISKLEILETLNQNIKQ